MIRVLTLLWLWVAHAQAGEYDTLRWARFLPENSGLARARVVDVMEAADGAIWFVHPDGSTSRFDAYEWRIYPAGHPLPDDISTAPAEVPTPPWSHFQATVAPIHRAILDSRGAVWLATETGAFRLAPDRWEKMIPAFRGMAHYQVRDILEDSYGILWFAAYDPISGEGSLSGLDPEGRWLFFNAHVEPGLGSNQVTALAEDRYGGLWVGTVEDGVSRYLGNNWTRWTAADSGLPDDRVIAVEVREDGQKIYIQTENGAAGYDIDLETWHKHTDSAPDVNPMHWPPPEDSAQFMAEGRDGRLYFGTERVYVLVYTPRPPASLTIARSMAAGGSAATYTVTAGAWWPAEALMYEVLLRGASGTEEHLVASKPADRAHHQVTVTVETANLEPGAYALCVQVFTPLLDRAETCARLVMR